MNLRCRASSEADGRGSPTKLVPVSPVAIAVLCGLIGAGLGLLSHVAMRRSDRQRSDWALVEEPVISDGAAQVLAVVGRAYVVVDAVDGVVRASQASYAYGLVRGHDIVQEELVELIRQVRARGLRLEWIIETHVHADHLSAAPYIQQQLGGKIGIGANIQVVQETFGKVFNEGTEFQRDGSQFDQLFDDGDRFAIGDTSLGLVLVAQGDAGLRAVLFGDDDDGLVRDELARIAEQGNGAIRQRRAFARAGIPGLMDMATQAMTADPRA